jgi:hypothetical protein
LFKINSTLFFNLFEKIYYHYSWFIHDLKFREFSGVNWTQSPSDDIGAKGRELDASSGADAAYT